MSRSSLEEVLRAETENRAWSKTLRQRASALLNSRLAKAISFEEYAVFRQQANEDAAECKRQGRILIDEIRSRPNVYLIGVDGDQDGLAPGKILTSVLKRVDVAVFTVAKDILDKKPPKGHLEFGLKDNGVGLTDFQYTKQIIGPKTIAEVRKLRDAIIAGKITPPQTREELANFKPVKL